MSHARRRFLLGMTAAAAGAAAARLPVSALAAARAQAQRSPFEMLVLGDSVMWGQGVPEEKKFYSVVRDKLVSDLLRRSDVRMIVRAHSGAHVLPRNEFAPRNYGEVPVAPPTLYAQAQMASVLYEYLYEDLYVRLGIPREEARKKASEEARKNVRFILLNGGINDVGVPTLANPFTRREKLQEDVERVCHAGMRDLLSFLAGMYPNALMVMTGYFKIITEGTDEKTLLELIKYFLGGKEYKRAEEANIRFAASASKGRGWLLDKLIALSEDWKTSTDDALAKAAADVNADPAYALKGGCPRVLFAKVDLKDDEGYNAPHTALWKIIEGPRTNDTLYTYRAVSDDDIEGPDENKKVSGVCLPKYNRLGTLDRQICKLAGTGHPDDKKGQTKYVDAIIEQLRPCVGYLAGGA